MNIQSTIDLLPGGRRRQALRRALIASYLERIIQIVEARRSIRTVHPPVSSNGDNRPVDLSSDLEYHLRAEG